MAVPDPCFSIRNTSQQMEKENTAFAVYADQRATSATKERSNTPKCDHSNEAAAMEIARHNRAGLSLSINASDCRDNQSDTVSMRDLNRMTQENPEKPNILDFLQRSDIWRDIPRKPHASIKCCFG
jgi:hypothetical protein